MTINIMGVEPWDIKNSSRSKKDSAVGRRARRQHKQEFQKECQSPQEDE